MLRSQALQVPWTYAKRLASLSKGEYKWKEIRVLETSGRQIDPDFHFSVNR